jgi:GT2 family glycosyltransferase
MPGTGKAGTGAKALRSCFSLQSDRQVVGHVLDPSDPDTRFVVELLIDGAPVALGRADRFDADLAREGFGDGCYGFGFMVASAALCSARLIEVRLANGEPLGAPLLAHELAPSVEPAPAAGAARWMGGLRIGGWVVGEPGERRVRALIDGDIVAEAPALRWTQVGDGRDARAALGFDLHLPFHFADGRAHFAEIHDESGGELAGSPCAFVAFEDGLAHFIERHAEIESEKPRGDLFDRLFPQSLPFSMFAEWRAKFERKGSAPESGEGAAASGAMPKIAVALVGERDVEASVASLQTQQGCEWVAAVLESGESELAFPNESLRDFLDGDARDCEAIVFAPSGASFEPRALARLARALTLFPAAPTVYGDYSFKTEDGGEWPVALPAFDYERALEQGCGALLFAVRLDLAQAAAMAGAADLFRLFLFALDGRRPKVQEFVHGFVRGALPKPSTSAAEDAPVHAPGFLAGLPSLDRVSATGLLARATEAHLRARGVAARIEPGFGSLLPAVRVARPPPRAKVSLMIVTRDRADVLRACVDSLFATVDLARHEAIVLDNESSDPDTLADFERLARRGVRVVRVGGPFNFARIVNKGATAATGEFLLLLQNDVVAREPGWLEEMLGRMAETDVGGVGATLLTRGGGLRQAGVTLGPGFDARAAFCDRMDGDSGYGDQLRVAHEVSAVSPACMLTRRSLFFDVGGFDAEHFPALYHDVDYCLKLRARGLRVVQTPYARLIQAEGDGPFIPEERRETERRLLRAIWGEALAADPYYNPLLSLDPIAYAGLAWPPRPSPPRKNSSPAPRILPPGF